jgi:lysophospholipase L1-like esterase
MFRKLRSILLLLILSGTPFRCAQMTAQTPTYDSLKIMAPFWEGDMQYNESVLMVSVNNEPAEASLLFPAIRIISVRNARLTTAYVQGSDWNYINGKLVLTSGSKCPFITNSQLYPVKADSNAMNKTGGGYILFHEGSYFHDHQLVVTYEKSSASSWQGPVPQYAESSMSKTITRLKKGQPLTVVLYGCSTSAGSNASAFTEVPPYMPSFGKLVIDKLSATYKSKITFFNPSIGGKTAEWGAKNVRSLVSSKKPDLVIIEFGMNDAYNVGFAPDTFKNNILSIINDVKEINPNAEFILIGPLHANPEAALFEGKQPQYEAKLEELKGTGVIVVNMTGVHTELLKHKKLLDMTGNNVNHPNDYLIRWFAQEIAYTLIKPDIISWFINGQKVNGDMIGFSYNKEYNLPDYVPPARFEKDLDIQKSSGARWVKLECPFTDFEPVAPTRPGDPDDKGFDWKTADRMFNAVKARGLNLLWTFRGTPPWASAIAGVGNHDTAPKDNMAFGNFCKAVVLRYLPQAKASGIKMAFEIWSEPNKGITFLPFSGDENTQPAEVAAYFVDRCIKPGYTGIHSAIDILNKKYGGYTYADAQVIVGGLLSDNTITDRGPGQTNTPELWVKAFYANGAKGYFDAISTHCHCFPDTSDFINSIGMIHTEQVYRIMSDNGDGDKKIWATGIGWPTRGMGGIEEKKLSSCLTQFFDMWYSQKFSGPWIYFQLRDIDSGSEEPVNNFGLLHTDYSLKNGYYTFSGRINTLVK